jgi:hypothetical protein
MRLLTAVCVAAACLAAAPAPLAAAEPRTETASAGPVAATLTYTVEDGTAASDVRLAVTRDGAPVAVARDGLVLAGCEKRCAGAVPVGALEGSGASSLTLADLAGDGDPEIIVDFFTGGAHCCSISAIYGWDPATSAYRRVIKFWGDPGYRLRSLGGPGQDLVTGDYRFAYAFCAYACSAMPVVAYRYRAFALHDVSDEHADLMRSQNRELRRSIRELARDPEQWFAIRGVLPALCANLYRLGEGASCRRELRRAQRRGWLGRAGKDEVWPAGRRYVPKLMRFLDRAGYR